MHDKAVPLDEVRLIIQAKAGNADAYATLTQRYGLQAYRVAYAILGNHHDAEDAAQEGILAAWNALSTLKADQAFGVWLARTVANRAKDLIRRQKRHREVLAENETVASPVVNPIEERLQQNERSRNLWHAISQLPEEKRVILRLYYSGEFTTTQVAHILDKPPGTIRRQLSEMYQTLRNLLRGGDQDG